MSRTEAQKIVKKYARALQEADFPFTAVYLFGSHARERAGRWSDIDVAVVSDALTRNTDEKRFRLWDIRLDVDTRIEPHGFTVKNFANDADPMAHEIRKTGIRVA